MDLFSTNWDTKKFQTCFIIILFCAVSNKIQIGSCPRFNLIKNIEILSDTSVHKSLKNTSFYIHFICLKLMMEFYGQGWKKNHSVFIDLASKSCYMYLSKDSNKILTEFGSLAKALWIETGRLTLFFFFSWCFLKALCAIWAFLNCFKLTIFVNLI